MLDFLAFMGGSLMVRIFIVAALLAVASGASAAQVFKCVGADGKTAFSDRPCSANAEAVDIKDNRIGGSFSPSDEWLEVEERGRKISEINRRYDNALRSLNKGPCRSFSSTELRSMVIANGVAVGMTVSDATRAWGPATRVNGSQHAYHWPRGGSSYFYVQSGCVTSVQGSYGG